jgi:pimeloyl-ACP methyl ester carboxylesterase
MSIEASLIHPKSKTQNSHNPANSSMVNYVRSGSGTPIVLIHGLAASLHDWDYLIPELKSNGFEACALDLLGHGGSYKPDFLNEYTAHRVYAHFQEWMDTLFPSEPVFLIGHSLGGYLGLIHSLNNPHRVKGLVLVNPYYSLQQMSTFLRLIFRRSFINTTLIQKTPYWLFRLLIDITSLEMGFKYTHKHSLPEDVRIQTALDYKRAAPGIYNIPRTLDEIVDQLPLLTVPTLVTWGVEDRTLNPISFQDLVNLLPNVTAKPIINCGHVPHQCNYNAFNKLAIDFLLANRGS